MQIYYHEMGENHGDGSQHYQSTEQNPTTSTTLFLWQRGRAESCSNSGDLDMITRGIDEIVI